MHIHAPLQKERQELGSQATTGQQGVQHLGGVRKRQLLEHLTLQENVNPLGWEFVGAAPRVEPR